MSQPLPDAERAIYKENKINSMEKSIMQQLEEILILAKSLEAQAKDLNSTTFEAFKTMTLLAGIKSGEIEPDAE